jgi:hypothetical protein
MRRLIFALMVSVAQFAHAAEPIATVQIPQVSCRVASCNAVGTVQALGGAIPAGATLVRWDGATFTTATAAAAGATTAVASPDAIYDVPVGEELAVQGQPGAAAIVTAQIGRYQVGAGAGPVRFGGLAVTVYDDRTMTPAAISLSYSDDYPPQFLRAVRQYTLLRSLVSGARNQDLSTGALHDIIQAAQEQPRPAASDGARPAATAFSFTNPNRTYYEAPEYTEQRISGPQNTRQAIEVCGNNSTGKCASRVAYVRPENLDTVYLHCRNEGGSGINGDCAWLRAHDFVYQYGISLAGAGRCLAESGDPQRVFHGYLGDAFACRHVYGGDVLTPEAEYAIFDRVLSEFQE